jgi:predicted KAP-like P-loop ATPase
MTSKKENYTADKPVTEQVDDAFQRYSFSKRIADTIISRNQKESIVFGIFGAWGEGKTSVINFIRNEISKAGDDFIQITFNPWRFTDEAALLTSFFNTLAREIKKNVPETQVRSEKSSKPNWFKRQKQKFEERKEPLKTNTEAIGDLIKDYGKLAALFGAGEVAETIGKAVSNVDIETLKSRIETLLESHGKQIIIYLDDIDRLDKNEIHSIFRLVKLTGDFAYTNYILSFDQEMVSAAIGERFGKGDKQAGENFLEKIIQVPLSIPKAQPDALKKFCFSLVDNAILKSDLNLSEEDVQRFVYQFTTNILGRLTTPRLAVRYGNTLSFSLPLLKGEVNIIDLMLIEALRVFYPEHYFFVKNNPDYFIGSYTETYGHGNNQEKIESIKKHFERLEKNLHEKDKPKVRDLLSNLFPRLETAFGNYHFGNETYNEWFLQKRIVSTKYFDRYFSYSVIEGDISDVEFDILLQFIAENNDIQAITSKVQNLIDKTSKDNFMQKLRSLENEYEWESAKRISKVLCDLSENLPKEGGMMSMGFETPFGQAAIFILQLLKNHKDKDDLFEFAKELMTYPKQFEFAYEINNWLRSGKRPEEKLFDKEQYVELAKILTDRALLEAKDKSIFECFPEHIGYLGHTWAERDKPDFDKYVDSFLEKDEKNVLFLLKSYVPTVRSSSKPKPFKGDLTKDRYEYLVSFYDKEKLLEKITGVFTLEEIQSEDPFWIDFGEHDFTDLNMVRQFYKWYQQGITEEKK